jgi:transcriptional regulator with XRE-family HTH domain
MVNRVRVKSGLTDKELATKFGLAPQTISNWRDGKVPRDKMIPQVAAFLSISEDMAGELIEEARISTGSTRIPPGPGAPITALGEKVDEIRFAEFPKAHVRPNIDGMFAIRIGGEHLWAHPDMQPREGHTVLVRDGDNGRLVKWPAELEGGEKVAGVVMLMEVA